LILCAGFIWHYISPVKIGPTNIVLYILISYAVTALFLRWLQKIKAFKSDNLLFTGQLFEAFIIMLIIKFTGGVNSQFFLVYFPIVAFLSIYSSKWRAIIGIFWYGAFFMLSIYAGDFSLEFWNVAAARLAALWAVGLFSFSIAHNMKTSEGKLLKTLDTLNERTWELESSQAQLSNIYETTRALSGILNLEELLKEILRIAHNIFRYKYCNIYLTRSGGDELYLFARLDNENRHIYEKPEPYNRDISDLESLQDTGSMVKRMTRDSKDGKSKKIDVPMISRGKVIGIMQVTIEFGNAISAREIILCCIKRLRNLLLPMS
jgi:hypothetical protein